MKPCNHDSGSFQGSPCLNCAQPLAPQRYRISWRAVLLVVAIAAVLGWMLAGRVYPCLRKAQGCRDLGFAAAEVSK